MAIIKSLPTDEVRVHNPLPFIFYCISVSLGNSKPARGSIKDRSTRTVCKTTLFLLPPPSRSRWILVVLASHRTRPVATTVSESLSTGEYIDTDRPSSCPQFRLPPLDRMDNTLALQIARATRVAVVINLLRAMGPAVAQIVSRASLCLASPPASVLTAVPSPQATRAPRHCRRS